MIVALLLILIGIILCFTGIGLIIGVPLIIIGGMIIIYKIIKGGFKSLTKLF